MWKVFFCGECPECPGLKRLVWFLFPHLGGMVFNSDSAQRIIGDHNATAQELSTPSPWDFSGCSALLYITERDLELGVKGDAVGQTFWACWCDYIVWFMACHVSVSRITGVEVREVVFFLNFWAQPTPRIKACSWSCASYKLRHLLPLVVANC